MKERVKLSAREKILRMVMVALFAALAYSAMFLFRIKVSFLTFDIKDCIIVIGGLLFGPVAAVVISVVVAVLEFITVSDTGVYGLLMNFVSSAAFACVAALIYRIRRDLLGAVIGLVSAVFSVTAVMLLMNLLVTPLFTGWEIAAVAEILPTLILPFNLTKATMNAALVLILYKPVSTAIRYARVKLPGGGDKVEVRRGDVRTNVLMTLAGLLLVAASLILFFVLMGGHIEWFVKIGA